MKEEVIEIIQNKFDLERIIPTYRLKEDLGIDSVESIELLMDLENHFDIYIKDSDWEKVKTVEDIFKLIKKW